jgi:hypothetical protein
MGFQDLDVLSSRRNMLEIASTLPKPQGIWYGIFSVRALYSENDKAG